MQLIEFDTPEYLFCEIPIKDKSINDERVWIYCPKALSLIEFVNQTVLDERTEEYLFDFDKIAGRFHYLDDFEAFWVQNNCEATDNDKEEILQGAWKFYLNYMKWEEGNLDEKIKSDFN